MSELLVFSFDAEASPAIRLRDPGTARADGEQPFGWGFAWYPGGEPAAIAIKDPTSTGEDPMTHLLRDWERFRSTIFVCHLRGGVGRVTLRDTQPFVRHHAGRHWVFAHGGDLAGDWKRLFPLPDDGELEPLGRTDSEHVFCWILSQLRAGGIRRLAELPRERLLAWCERINHLGPANLVLSDGEEVAVYRDAGGARTLHAIRRRPPHSLEQLASDHVTVELDTVRDARRTMLVFSTRPLSEEVWTPLARGQLLVARGGQVVWDSADGRPAAAAPEAQAPERRSAWTGARRRPAPAGAGAASRVLRVVHETVYRYAQPVERSSHRFRLTPVHDRRQELLEHRLECSVPGTARDFEDVFGNQTRLLEISEPFEEMRVCAESRVRVLRPEPLDLVAGTRRDSIPVPWMPWQRQMMQSYLLPQELPETQLQELTAFAMSFVARNDQDLLETLLDMNRTLWSDFSYVSGSTDLATTPYDVYATRRGVCQDFANLLICLARLLGVPARYRMGYIDTRAAQGHRVQSEASHAWAEIYLPWAGWYGLDPTNGCQAGLDHVRVACGRNYRDATPTSGTLYRGGAGETLRLAVRVEVVDEA